MALHSTRHCNTRVHDINTKPQYALLKGTIGREAVCVTSQRHACGESSHQTSSQVARRGQSHTPVHTSPHLRIETRRQTLCTWKKHQDTSWRVFQRTHPADPKHAPAYTSCAAAAMLGPRLSPEAKDHCSGSVDSTSGPPGIKDRDDTIRMLHFGPRKKPKRRQQRKTAVSSLPRWIKTAATQPGKLCCIRDCCASSEYATRKNCSCAARLLLQASCAVSLYMIEHLNMQLQCMPGTQRAADTLPDHTAHIGQVTDNCHTSQEAERESQGAVQRGA